MRGKLHINKLIQSNLNQVFKLIILSQFVFRILSWPSHLVILKIRTSDLLILFKLL